MMQRSARESAILDAALELVSELGFDRVTMDAVAQRAQASKATIYRHWAGKVELVVDAMRCRTCPDTEPVPTGSLRGDLLVAVAVMSEGMVAADGRLMLGLVMASQRDAELAELLRTQLYEAKRQIWLDIAERAVASGELRDADAATDVFADVLPALAVHRHMVLGLPLDTEWQRQVVDGVVLPLVHAAIPDLALPSA